MKAFSIFCLGVLAAIPTLATTSDFNFTSGSPTCNNCSATSGNYVFSGYSVASGVGATPSGTVTDTVTMTAWEVPISGSGSTGDLKGAYTGFYSGYGVGICSTVEGSGCNSPLHQVDNNDGDYEFMELQFSSAVNISQITLANFGTNGSTTNLSNTLFYSSSSINLGSTTLSTLESSDNPQNFDCTSAGSTSCTNANSSNITYSDPLNSAYGADAPTVTDNVSMNNVTTLIIAAQIGQTNDFFKIQAVNAQLSTGNGSIATPEPSTFAMLGLALAGLGIYGRRKRCDPGTITKKVVT